MIELLVVMVIVALLGGVIVPNISQWIESSNLAQQKKALQQEIASLPAKAFYTQKKITIVNATDLDTSIDGDLRVNKPIEVLSNGYCLGGELHLSQFDQKYTIRVTQPLCKVSFQ